MEPQFPPKMIRYGAIEVWTRGGIYGIMTLVGVQDDKDVLRLILRPRGQMSDTVRGAIPLPAIVQRRQFGHHAVEAGANASFSFEEGG
jgi:hypothetical protein